jgi:hypothetical protein
MERTAGEKGRNRENISRMQSQDKMDGLHTKVQVSWGEIARSGAYSCHLEATPPGG